MSAGEGVSRSGADAGAKRVAVVTGASSGFGAAAARALAADGFSLVLGARRLDRLQAVAEPLGARALPLDVTDAESVAAFAAAVPRADVVIANAGGALGLDRIAEAHEDRWEWMFQTNVMGSLRTVRAFLPHLEASGDGLVIVVGSTAAFETYPGGAGYTASKHALRAFVRTLRLELLGKPIRVTELDPGMAETEFSLVRFGGDGERARQVYSGMEPLTGDDIAECIRWICALPGRVNIDEMVVRPRDQATSTSVHRRPVEGGGRA